MAERKDCNFRKCLLNCFSRHVFNFKLKGLLENYKETSSLDCLNKSNCLNKLSRIYLLSNRFKTICFQVSTQTFFQLKNTINVTEMPEIYVNKLEINLSQ